jgi:hypothetical protein
MSVAPLPFLMLVFAGWVNRCQLELLEYIQEEPTTTATPGTAPLFA